MNELHRFRFTATEFDALIQLCAANAWLSRRSEALGTLWEICDSDEQKELLEFLIRKITYVDSAQLDAAGHALAHQIRKGWGLTPATTIITATCDNANVDGSQALVQSFKNKFMVEQGWLESNFFSSMPVSLASIKDGMNVVLVDDFAGTGSTIKRRAQWYCDGISRKKVRGVKVFVALLAAMENSRAKLDEIGVPYFAQYWLRRGISDQIEDPTQRARSIEMMKRLEKKLGKKWKGKDLYKYSLGYDRTEALYNWEGYNVPNNVFPIFWWPMLIGDAVRHVLLHRLSP